MTMKKMKRSFKVVWVMLGLTFVASAPSTVAAEPVGGVAVKCTTAGPAGTACIAAGTVALVGELMCSLDKSHSCTDGVKTAGQDAIDLIRVKRNPLKSMTKNLVRRPTKEVARSFRKLGRKFRKIF